MIRLIKKLLQLIIIFAVMITLLIGTLGYLKYKAAVNATPITEKVESIKVSKNYTPLDEINTDFLDAIVAIEDHRFYSHGPIDPIALVRATVTNLYQKEVVQGGITVTQQVAKNIYFENDQNFIRKVAELFVAYQLEQAYSKDDILELYVNVIYYGDGNYGIFEASQNYFNKLPSELTFDEATLLAGLPQAPSAYALSTNYERAKKRQTEVIEALEKYNK